MMDAGLHGYSGRFIVVTPAGIEVPLEAREVASGYLDPDPMSWSEKIAGRHGAHLHLVDLPFFHEHFFVISFAVAKPLYRLVEVVCLAIGMDIQELQGDVGILSC